MKLSAWISKKKLTHAAFGAMIGATQAAVSRYVSGQRVPRPRVMARIVEVTKGQVTANDFVPGVPSVREAA